MKKLTVLLVVFIITMFTACSSTDPVPPVEDTTGADVSTSTDGAPVGGDVEILNVGAIYEFNVPNFTSNIMQMLGFENFSFVNPVRIDSNAEIVPSFAKSYEIAEDGLSITFKIPTDAKWHDGVPVTAEDFKFSIDYCINTLKTMKTYFESCDIIDAETVRVNLLSTSPVVTLRHWTFWNRTALLPKHIWENVEDPASFDGEGSMVGCGPYQFDKYDADAQILYFDAYEEYHLGAPTVKRIAFKLYDSKESVIMALKNNDIDCFYQYATGLNGQYADAILDLEGFDAGLVTNMGVPMMSFNMSENSRSDLAVRQAVSKALDFEMLAATLGNGYATVGGKGVLNPISEGYDPTIGLNEQNQEEAKSILDNAGYVDVDGDGLREDPNAQPFEQIVVSQQSTALGNFYDRLAQIVVRDLIAVGIDARLNEDVLGNADKYKDVILNKEYDIHLVGTTGGANYIDTAFKYLSTERTGYYGGTLSDPAFLELYFGLLDSITFETYSDYRTQLQHYVAQELPAIALGWDEMFYPYNTDQFDGWVVREGHGPFTYETWFNLQTKA